MNMVVVDGLLQYPEIDRTIHFMGYEGEGERQPSISSAFDQPEVNPDGSVDIYFGPLEPFFDQTWRPDDITEIK